MVVQVKEKRLLVNRWQQQHSCASFEIHFRILSVRYPKFYDPALSMSNTLAQLIHASSILEPQRSSMIKHITTRGGIWPPTNNELVAKYVNVFLRFVKSIDFRKL
jgi:hypothetical protein